MSATMVWYVMYTFCHWYKDTGTHCSIILKLQTAEENSKNGLFRRFIKRFMNLLQLDKKHLF